MNVRRSLRLVAGSAIAVFAFVATCFVVRELLPFPAIYRVHSKITYFHEHADEFDTLFVGSSRINHQIIPTQFDELTRAAGVPTKSFNAGIAGMRPPEDSYFFEQLVATKPRNLKWVFIEVNDIRPRMDWNLRGTVRAQYWHDPVRLGLVFRRLTTRPGKKGGSGERWRLLKLNAGELFEHVEFFVREMTNLGKGDAFAELLLKYPDRGSTRATDLGPDYRGWIETGRGEAVAAMYKEKFERERAERLVKPAEREAHDQVSQENLERMIALTEKLGATPVLIVPPVTAKAVFYPSPERVKRSLVLDFNDPRKFPQLYADAHRLDNDHLNTAGSRVFTKLIVEHWLAASRKGEAR